MNPDIDCTAKKIYESGRWSATLPCTSDLLLDGRRIMIDQINQGWGSGSAEKNGSGSDLNSIWRKYI